MPVPETIRADGLPSHRLTPTAVQTTILSPPETLSPSAPSRSLRRGFLLVGLLLVGLPTWQDDGRARLHAQPSDRGESVRRTEINWVDEGARGLSRTARFPWYDSARDGVRPVHPLPPRDLAGNRHSAWEDMDRPTTPPRKRNRSGQAFGEFLRVASWVILIVAAILLALALGWALLLRESSEVQRSRRRKFAVERVAWQMEQLPFDLDPGNLDLLGEAQRSDSVGDYRRAMIYLFGYQLAYLDQHQLIHLERGSTNRQYLRQLRSHPGVSSLFEPTMILFEEVFFGGRPIARAQMDVAWERLEAFHQQLEPPPP